MVASGTAERLLLPPGEPGKRGEDINDMETTLTHCPECHYGLSYIDFIDGRFLVVHSLKGRMPCYTTSDRIKAAEKQQAELDAFIESAWAEYTDRSVSILQSEGSLDHMGGSIREHRRQWLKDTLSRYSRQQQQPAPAQSPDWQAIALEYQEKLKAAMFEKTELEKNHQRQLKAMQGTSRGAECDLCGQVYANYTKPIGEPFFCAHCSAIGEIIQNTPAFHRLIAPKLNKVYRKKQP